MRQTIRHAAYVIGVVILVACVPLTPTPEPADAPPVAVEAPTETPEPTLTVAPTMTHYPTPVEVAPDQTFTPVGSVAHLAGEHGVAGKAIVTGLQTLIIAGFHYDGKGPQADIRLVNGENYDEPAAILLVLDQRPYDGVQPLIMVIPNSAGPGTADSIAVYVPETGEVYAHVAFE